MAVGIRSALAQSRARRARRRSSRLVDVDDGVVGWIAGGEPREGCDLVQVLIRAESGDAVLARADRIGLWHTYAMDRFGHPPRDGVAAALGDPEGFVWSRGDGGPWLPSRRLERPD